MYCQFVRLVCCTSILPLANLFMSTYFCSSYIFNNKIYFIHILKLKQLFYCRQNLSGFWLLRLLDIFLTSPLKPLLTTSYHRGLNMSHLFGHVHIGIIYRIISDCNFGFIIRAHRIFDKLVFFTLAKILNWVSTLIVKNLQ